MAEITQGPPPHPRAPLRRRGYVAVAGIIAFFLIVGCFALWVALVAGEDWHLRLMMLLLALLALALPARWAWVTVRRKWKTGRWGVSEEERSEWRRKNAEVNARKPAWLRFVPSWLRIGSRNPSGVSLVVAVVWTLAAGVYVVQAYRHGFDAWDTFFAAWWVMLASLWIWHLLRKRKAVAGSTDLTGS